MEATNPSHYQIWFNEYPGEPMRPSETCPKHEWAKSRAEDLQEAFPFGNIEIREVRHNPVTLKNELV